jgi:glycosyltransferase involved in cell wall biosynthesis
MGSYRGPINITLHIAGDGPEVPALKKIIDELGIAGKVVFHGFSHGKDLDTLFNTCQIAIGSLGLHRMGLTEASVLKAREYCAWGIPFIITCTDPDFSDDFPFILRIPADETPVDLETVIEFAHRVCKDHDHPRKMRTYAAEFLDWSVKMKRLKAFLETLVDKSS